MKRICGFLVLILAVLPWSFADWVVLKNGKRFQVPGTYKVNGNFVVFKTAMGELTQLPAKMVDLEKSKAFNEEMIEKKKQKELARINAAEEAEKRRKTDQYYDMSAIAAYVEKNRTDDNPRPSSVKIGDDTIESYNKTNPRPVTSTASHEAFDVKSAADRKATSREYGAGYLKLNDDLANLKDKLEEAKLRRDNNASIASSRSSHGSDNNDPYAPISNDNTNPGYRNMEKAEQDVAKYQKEIQQKESEITKYAKAARTAGANDFKRYKDPSKRKGKKQKNNDPEYAIGHDDGTDDKSLKIQKYDIKSEDGKGNNDSGNGNNDH